MDIFSSTDGTGLIFWGTAILGTVFFLLRVLLLIVGGFADVDGDALHSDATDIHGDGSHGDGTDVSFKLVSLNSITGFIMMFGWAGLASYLQFNLNSGISLLIALVVGLMSMYLTTMLFRMAMKLTSPGEVFDINSTVGVHGEVYLTIPSNGTGKITVTVNGVSRMFDAVSEEKNEITSFKKIVVTKIINSDTLSVKEI